MYNWYHSITASILLCTDIRWSSHMYRIYSLAISPLVDFPLAPLFNLSHLLGILTWIRPPRSQVARKLTSLFPSPGSLVPYPKSRPPGVFQTQIYIRQDDIANPTHKLAYTYSGEIFSATSFIYLKKKYLITSLNFSLALLNVIDNIVLFIFENCQQCTRFMSQARRS